MANLDSNTNKLFKQVRVKLGAPIRPVQLDDDILCTLLEMCLEDHNKIIQNFLIESQWSTLNNKSISQNDMAFLLSTRTFDYAKEWSYWFSKDVSLQQRGHWELKEDFITLEEGKQNYVIPAGREISKVMWFTPTTTNIGVMAMVGGVDMGGGAGMLPGFAQMGMMGGSAYGGGFMMNAYDSALLATDLAYKQDFIKSDLTYNVTAGPNGTRILHLLSTPGSKLNFGGYKITDTGSQMWSTVGRHIYYYYYETKTKEDAEDCRIQNPDVILTPDVVPMDEAKSFHLLNEPSKVTVRELLIAEAKILLGNIRGYASGKVSIMDAEMQLDYAMLHEQGKAEKEKAITELTDRLTRLMPAAQLKTQAEMAESLAKIKSYQPVRGWIIA